MSRRSELKRKKQEMPLVRADAALKQQNAVRNSSRLVARPSVADEKEKSKNRLLNSTSTTTSRAQAPRKVIGNSDAKKLVPRNVNTNLQPTRRGQVSSTSKVIRQSDAKADTKENHKKQNAALDTPQNVTVCSPPPKRKIDSGKSVSNDDKNKDNSKLIRKSSRILAPDEVVILKTDSAKMRSEKEIRNEYSTGPTLAINVKEPVAFEIKFEEKNAKEKLLLSEKFNKTPAKIESDEEQNYSDDFDSYESDFETESSTHSLTKSVASSLENENSKVPEESASQSDSLQQSTSEESGHEDDSEGMQNTITEIHVVKEKQLDSGHYDMNSGKTDGSKLSDIRATQPVGDSLETFSLGISEQMDSGVSTSRPSSPISYSKSVEIIFGGYKQFFSKPIINQRGSQLMKKIQLDVLGFTLIDLKPISYDIFMQTFGKLNTNQNFCQTESNQMNVEQQTEVQETRSIWTQHPAQHCCGEMVSEGQVEYLPHCALQRSLNALKEINTRNYKRNRQSFEKQQKRPTNHEHLNSFLLRSSLLIDQILGSSNTSTTNKPLKNPAYESDPALKRIFEKSFYLETNLLNSLKVSKLFSNNKYNLLITVHESLPDTDVYSGDFSNLLMVWCTNTCDKPLRLLTTWSQVSKVEISNDSSDIIVAALRDGSIALWDLRETNSFCSKLDGYLTHFAPTQSLTPSFYDQNINSKLIMDLGTCLDVKSFRSQSNNILIPVKFPKTQFASLHDSGIVTVWTLVETSEINFDPAQMEKYEKLKYSAKSTPTFEYTSPWARVKLTQSAIVNIKEYVELKSQHSQSRFDETKAFFQKNIYSDEALKELSQKASEARQHGLRFTSLECGSENVFICTNRNFILMCSKTLKMDKLKRIQINESQYLFPTALKLLSNEHFLAVGLSNGAIMILNCQTDKVTQTKRTTQALTPLAPTATGKGSADETMTGKSCAIQNMLLNMQKPLKDMDFDQEYRPNTAACITLIDSKKKPFELRILDQQVICSGSVLRQNLIQTLELSSNGWYLFALANGRLRIYDFYLDQEVAYEGSHQTGKITSISAGKCGYRENNLMILKPNTEVEVYIFKK